MVFVVSFSFTSVRFSAHKWSMNIFSYNYQNITSSSYFFVFQFLTLGHINIHAHFSYWYFSCIREGKWLGNTALRKLVPTASFCFYFIIKGKLCWLLLILPCLLFIHSCPKAFTNIRSSFHTLFFTTGEFHILWPFDLAWRFSLSFYVQIVTLNKQTQRQTFYWVSCLCQAIGRARLCPWSYI